MDDQATLPAPFGALGIRCSDDFVEDIRFLPPDTRMTAATTPLGRRAVDQLARWLTDPSVVFDLPLRSRGTAFQQRVWQALTDIAPGTTLTYGALAAALGSSARAVGQACGANPYPIVVPCHRVVARGALGGFAHARSGVLIETKQWLLRHELTPPIR